MKKLYFLFATLSVVAFTAVTSQGQPWDINGNTLSGLELLGGNSSSNGSLEIVNLSQNDINFTTFTDIRMTQFAPVFRLACK